MQVALKQIFVPPGQQLLVKDVFWQMYENILEELGEKRAARINYSQEILEIMTPLLGHEVNKVIIGDDRDIAQKIKFVCSILSHKTVSTLRYMGRVQKLVQRDRLLVLLD